ncbi:hypothetical protein T4B_13049 [Trichinella pseudospiralis]|uniref:Uncharacterized protein n=1 Tax=Trichinella pseudospiralis TaxID=6337 RepID=A0A0V1J1R0_TRIPS|nr:hypothetical protein T4A_5817 [Trichinella pseudospiralis]KRZ28908.1 hypothetical protein T4B_13049 [Trichinella pseudospiralis]
MIHIVCKASPWNNGIFQFDKQWQNDQQPVDIVAVWLHLSSKLVTVSSRRHCIPHSNNKTTNTQSLNLFQSSKHATEIRMPTRNYALQANTMATQQLHHALASSNAAGRCQVGSIVPCGRVGHSAMDKAHRGQQCVHPINSQLITR